MDIESYIMMLREKYNLLVDELRRRRIKISTMESCTSGLIASLITDNEGSSDVFNGAYVTYSNGAKIMNGVAADVIDTYGVYSKETACSMAKACADRYNADIGIGVTGTIGRIDPANKDSEFGVVYICVWSKRKDAFRHNMITVSGSCCSRFEAKLIVAFEAVIMSLISLSDETI